MRLSVRSGLLSLGATAALVLSGFAVAPAQAAAGEGQLTLSVVDPSGATLGGAYFVVPAGATSLDSPPTEVFWDTATGVVPSGRYGVVALSPWGGLLCAGVTPCDFGTLFGIGEISVTGVVDVPEEGTATYVLQAPVPAVVVGRPKVGETLVVDFSEPLDRILDVVGGLYGSTQWLRDGKVIPGATSASYSIRPGDVGHTIQPRISSASLLLGDIFGSPSNLTERRTLAGSKIAKITTRTKATSFRTVVPAGVRKSTWVDVVNTEAITAGKVTVRVGKWKKTKRLWNGNTRVLLPKLKRGRYAVRVSYAGTSVFAPSKDRFVIRVR